MMAPFPLPATTSARRAPRAGLRHRASASGPRASMRPLPRVAARLTGSFPGELMDLGVGGLALETSSRLTPRQRLEVHLGQGATLPAEIVWSSLHRTRDSNGDRQPIYRAGGSFLTREVRQAAERFDRLSSQAGGKLQGRRFRRFPASGTPGIRLGIEHLVAVRGVSPLGFRIETRSPLAAGSTWKLDLDLGDLVLHPTVCVTDCQPLAPDGEPRWAVELETIELDDEEAQALGLYCSNDDSSKDYCSTSVSSPSTG